MHTEASFYLAISEDNRLSHSPQFSAVQLQILIEFLWHLQKWEKLAM